MTPRFSVDVDELRAHGTHVDRIAEELAQVVPTISSANLSDDAYGKLCAALATMLRSVQNAGESALQTTTESVRDLADDLLDTADDYSGTDADNEENLVESGPGGGD